MVAPRAKRAEALYLAKSYSVSKARSARAKDDESVRTELVDLAEKNKRCGHPRLFVLLRARISGINHKRSCRIYSELGLQIGRRKRKKLGSQTGLPSTRTIAPMQVWAIEAFNSRVRDECLNEHVFFSIQDAREKIDQWHWRYNHHNPHSALGMRAPMVFAKEQKTMLAS